MLDSSHFKAPDPSQLAGPSDPSSSHFRVRLGVSQLALALPPWPTRYLATPSAMPRPQYPPLLAFTLRGLPLPLCTSSPELTLVLVPSSSSGIRVLSAFTADTVDLRVGYRNGPLLGGQDGESSLVLVFGSPGVCYSDFLTPLDLTFCNNICL